MVVAVAFANEVPRAYGAQMSEAGNAAETIAAPFTNFIRDLTGVMTKELGKEISKEVSQKISPIVKTRIIVENWFRSVQNAFRQMIDGGKRFVELILYPIKGLYGWIRSFFVP